MKCRDFLDYNCNHCKERCLVIAKRKNIVDV